MGQIVVVAYAAVAVLGLLLLLLGLVRRIQPLTLTGAGILLGLLGAWVMGLAGAGLALLVVPFFWRRRPPKDAARG